MEKSQIRFHKSLYLSVSGRDLVNIFHTRNFFLIRRYTNIQKSQTVS